MTRQPESEAEYAAFDQIGTTFEQELVRGLLEEAKQLEERAKCIRDAAKVLQPEPPRSGRLRRKR